MMRTCIFVIFLFIGTCSNPNKNSENKGAVIKYKYVDLKGNWLELGVEKGNKKYLIYMPKEYDVVYHIGDTL